MRRCCRSGSCPSTLSMFRSSTSRRRRGRVTHAEVVRERQRMEARHRGDRLRDWIGGSRWADQGRASWMRTVRERSSQTSAVGSRPHLLSWLARTKTKICTTLTRPASLPKPAPDPARFGGRRGGGNPTERACSRGPCRSAPRERHVRPVGWERGADPGPASGSRAPRRAHCRGAVPIRTESAVTDPLESGESARYLGSASPRKPAAPASSSAARQLPKALRPRT